MLSAYAILVQSAKCLQNRYSNTIVWSTYPGVSEKDKTLLYFYSLGQPVPIPPYAVYNTLKCSCNSTLIILNLIPYMVAKQRA